MIARPLTGDIWHFHWAKSGEYPTQVTAIGPLGLVAGSDAAEVLQLREEALDQVACWQQRLNNAPLEVGQIVSAHADAESGFHPMGKIASL
jgi:hypothetical protein